MGKVLCFSSDPCPTIASLFSFLDAPIIGTMWKVRDPDTDRIKYGLILSSFHILHKKKNFILSRFGRKAYQ